MDKYGMRDYKETFKYFRDVIVADIGFHILTTVSIFLIVASFFVPPIGVIDSSIFMAVGELFGFAALWELHVAVRRGTKASVTHGSTTIEINKKIEEEKESNINDDETE